MRTQNVMEIWSRESVAEPGIFIDVTFVPGFLSQASAPQS